MMRSSSLVVAWSLLAFGLVTGLTGCGGDGSVTVSGTVLADGKPVPKGSVRFVADKAKGNTYGQEPVGNIGPDGKYTLSAPLGAYKVSVVSQETPDSTKPNSFKSYVAAKFNNPESSGLSIEVVRSPAAGAYDLKVTEK